MEPEDINSQAASPQQLLPPSRLAAKLLTRIENRNASFFKVSYASPEAVPPASSLHSPTKGGCTSMTEAVAREWKQAAGRGRAFYS